MKPICFAPLLALTFCFGLSAFCQKNDPLQRCWKQQAKPLNNKYLVLAYQEQSKELNHDMAPWKETVYACNGTVWVNNGHFLKSDTLQSGTQTYYSKTQYSDTELLFLDYGDEKLFAVDQRMFQDQLHKSARYSPLLLLGFFRKNAKNSTVRTDANCAVYTQTIQQRIVQLWIDKRSFLLQKISVTAHDDLYGDVVTNYQYSDYTHVGKLRVAKTLTIDRIDGRIKETVHISNVSIAPNANPLLEKPIDYAMPAATPAMPEISVEQYGANIHFIALKHTDDKVMVVEFEDFMLVAEAPLSSENGAMIIAEAHKIAPKKPIRYFVFGHHHPHYLGGVRAFVHEGATVLSAPTTIPYVEYLAKTPHLLQPDQLQKEPRPLKTEAITASKTITDGNFEMVIYFIGEQSKHTNDYLVYYFPKEKLLFEDDLVWIAKTGEIKKASGRQLGLYNAIKDLGLAVETIIQSWPVAEYGVKTVIPFADLKQSVSGGD